MSPTTTRKTSLKTIDQVRQEAHPSNKYDFYNEAYYEPILHYYIVEKDISAGTAKIVKVFPVVMPKYQKTKHYT